MVVVSMSSFIIGLFRLSLHDSVLVGSCFGNLFIIIYLICWYVIVNNIPYGPLCFFDVSSSIYQIF